MARRMLYSDSLVKICFIIVAVLFIWSVFDSAQASSNNYRMTGSYKLVYVNQGETVWSIAAKHIGDNEDIRSLVSAIKQLNKMDNDVQIYPGQALKIPLKQTTGSFNVAKASTK